MKTISRIAVVGILMFGLASSSKADLVAHWPLDSDGSDAGGQYDGTANAGVTFGAAGANGNTGTSATFDGSGVVQVPFDAALNPDSFTLTAWVNPSDSTDWNSVVTSREDNGTSVNGYILYNTPQNEWDFWTGGGGAPGTWGRNIGPNATLDAWTHLAISYDGGTDTKILWVNGENAAEVTGQGYVPNGSTPASARPFNIGAGQDFGDGFYFNGQIDDVGLYNTALSQGEIQSVMMNGVPEPSSIALMLLGGLSLFSWRRRRT